VDIYSHAWLKDPIVKGFIGESGGATMCGLVTNSSRESWPKLVASLKCNTPSDELACMRKKSIGEIIEGAGKIGKWFPPAFVPMPDGKIAFDDYPARVAKGQYIKAVSSALMMEC
jgi:cholinesterase